MIKTPEGLHSRRMLGVFELLAMILAACQPTQAVSTEELRVVRDQNGKVMEIAVEPGVIQTCETPGNELWEVCQRIAGIFGVSLAAIPPYAIVGSTRSGEACPQQEGGYSRGCYIGREKMSQAVGAQFPEGLIVVDEDEPRFLLHEAAHAFIKNDQGARINEDGSCSGLNEGDLGRVSADGQRLEINVGTDETFVRILSLYAGTKDYAGQLLAQLPPETSREEKIKYLTDKILLFEYTLAPDGKTLVHEPWQQSMLDEFDGLIDVFGNETANMMLRGVMGMQVDGKRPFGQSGLFNPDNSRVQNVEMTILAQEMRSFLTDAGYDLGNLPDGDVLILAATILNPKPYSDGLVTVADPTTFYYYVPACPVTVPIETVTVSP